MATRRKPQVNATLPPILVEKIDEGLKRKKYTSASEAVSVALSEHFTREEIRENEWKIYKIYEILIEHPEGQAILNEFEKTKEDKKDAWIRAGIAHVEVGEYEEAKICFAKAKAIESGQSIEKLKNSGRINYASQKEREEECLKKICPEPRALTAEEARKAAKAKKYSGELLGEKEDTEELPNTFTRKVIFD